MSRISFTLPDGSEFSAEGEASGVAKAVVRTFEWSWEMRHRQERELYRSACRRYGAFLRNYKNRGADDAQRLRAQSKEANRG